MRDLADLLAYHHGVLTGGDAASRWLARQATAGRLMCALPGTYVAAPPDLETLVLAVCQRYPDAVVIGRAAARLTYWPGIPVTRIEVAARVQLSRSWAAFSSCAIPPELVLRRGPIRLAAPALTALDLAVETDGAAIDEVLRGRAATLEMLGQALAATRGRRGNQARRRMLLDSRGEPWSVAERCCHRELRRGSITGWVANLRVESAGRVFFLDVAFRAERVYLEVDGRGYHSDAVSFERDRERENALVAAGWLPLHVTWRMLQDDPDAVIRQLRALLDRRRRQPRRRAVG